MNKASENKYGYSIGLTEIAVLNADKSFPAPNDWEDEHPQTGEVRKHRGGLVGKNGTFNLENLHGDDLKLGVSYGKKYEQFDFVPTAVDLKKVTVAELATDFNTAFETLEDKGISLKAQVTEKGEDYDAEYLKITTQNVDDLPFYARIGFTGKLADLLGITGWVATKEAKSFKDDFEKEAGKTVDATSGHGIRCTIKEADKIKGVNLTANFASVSDKLYSQITGNTYNEETGETYIDNALNPPLIGFRFYVEQYETGINTKGSFTKVKAIMFPSCQITPNGNDASEDNFATEEIQGSGGENKRSNLPLKFIKEIGLADYTQFVS